MKRVSLLERPRRVSLIPWLALASGLAGCDCGTQLISVTAKISVNPPKVLAFGTSGVNTTVLKAVSVTNVGEAPLVVSAVRITSGGNVFSIPAAEVFTFDCTGKARNASPATTIEAGDCATFAVGFDPVATTPATGELEIASNDPTTPSYPLELTGTGSRSCTVDGPVPHIVATESGAPLPASVLPLTTVELSGATSTTPTGTTITNYAWTLESAPPNNQFMLMSSGKTATLYSALAGDYEVKLTITNSANCQASTVFSYKVVPGAGIHVELTWDQSFGDLDLHYVGPGGAIFDNGTYETSPGPPAYPNDGDLFYIYSHESYCGTTALGDNGYPSPDWGGNDTISPDGTSVDDASLDVDQQCGFGPENATHPHPFDGDFEVMVHEWCSGNNEMASSNGAPITAVIQVFFDSAPVWKGSQALTYDEVWDAAKISVSNNGAAATVTAGTGGVTNAGDMEGCNAGSIGFSRRHRKSPPRDE